MTIFTRAYDGTQPVRVEQMHGNTFNGEDGAHQFVITGVPTGTVTAYMMRADGTTCTVNGTNAEDTATVTLNQDCYNVPGRFTLSVFVGDTGARVCVYACVGTVYRTRTETIIDSGDVVPSLDDVIAKQAELAQDVADASSAIASAQNAVSYLAPGFLTSRTYAVGEYVTKDGVLYICTTAVETAGAWNATNWQAVTFGEEITDLKSAITDIENIFQSDYQDITPSQSNDGYFIGRDGEEVSSASCSYKTINITGSMTGKDYKISGSQWYSVNPYVFVGTSGESVIPEIETSATPVQYTDLPFTPVETGTLYINIYRGQIGKAEYLEIDTSSIKADVLPINEIGENMTDTNGFSEVNLGTLITSKLLNGSTGEITNGTHTNQRVSDYVAVLPNTDYLITTQANYGRGMLAWYTSNKSFIGGMPANSGSTMTRYFGKKVKSPSNAAYVVIGYIYDNPHPFPVLMQGNTVSVYESSKWEGKKWAVVGDSLSASYTPTGIHYFEFISGETGIEVTNVSESGNGYAKGVWNFTYQVQHMPTNVDVVTFFGSGNDQSSGLELGTASDTGDTTIAGCINRAIDALYAINPLIPLGIITPTPWKGKMPYDDGWMESYANLIVEICKKRSVPCLDLYHCSGLDTNNATVISMAYSRDDGNATHLNELGQKFITPKIKSFLETLIM